MYRRWIRPWLFAQDAETVHEQVTALAKVISGVPGGQAMVSALYQPPQDDRLTQTLWGQTFMHPVGLAAGFDKHVSLAPMIHAMGMAYAELGSLSAHPWPGNPKPRLFRLPLDEAIINRMGLNNVGVSAVQGRLRALSQRSWPVGISLVKTPDPAIMDEAGIQDFTEAMVSAYGLGAYVSLNISCPNTEEGKTFEDPQALAALLKTMREAEAKCQAQTGVSPRPWLLKVSPNLSDTQLAELFEVGCRYQVAGWIAGNTSAQRAHLKTDAATLEKIGRGGLSGPPIRQLSTHTLARLYQLSRQHAPEQVLIGVGGIDSVEAAWEKITHGASLLQVYTGLIYQGPGLVKTIVKSLSRRLDAEGYPHITHAVGIAFR